MVAFMLGLNNWSWSQNSKMFFNDKVFFFLITRGSINVEPVSGFILRTYRREINWGYSQQEFHRGLHSVRWTNGLP